MNLGRRLFGCEPGEGVPVLWLGLVFFAVKAAAGLAETYADAAFLKRFGVEWLPHVYLANAAFVFVFLNAIGSWVDRVARRRFLVGLFLASGAVLLGARLAVGEGLELVYPALLVVNEQVDNLFSVSFWLLAGEAFTTRQSKRLFPLVAAGGILGTIAGSLAAPLVARWIAADNLLLVSAGALLLGAAATLLAGRRLLGEAPLASVPAARQEGGLWRLLRRSLLLRLLLPVVLVPGLLAPLVDYQFNWLATHRYGNEADLLAFYGYFKAAFYGVILLLFLFATGRLFLRLGIARVLYFLPVNYLAYFAVVAGWLDILVGMTGKVTTKVVTNTFHNAAKKNLFNFFPDNVRGKVTLFFKGTVSKLGALAGSGLLLLVPAIGMAGISWVGCGLAALGLAAAWFFSRNYARIVANSLAARQLDLESLAGRGIGEMLTPAVETSLAARLADPDEAAAALAARILVFSGRPAAQAAVIAALGGFAPRAQGELVDLLRRAALPEVLPALGAALDVPGGPARALWVEIAAERGLPGAAGLVDEALASRDPALAVAGLAAAFGHGAEAARSRALGRLAAMLAEPARGTNRLASVLGRLAPGDGQAVAALGPWLVAALAAAPDVVRRAAVEACGRLRLADAVPALVGLARGADAPLARRAVQALGAIADPAALPELVERLGDPSRRVRRAAGEATRGLGREALPALAAALGEPRLPLKAEAVLEVIASYREHGVDPAPRLALCLAYGYRLRLDQAAVAAAAGESRALGLVARACGEQADAVGRVIVRLLCLASTPVAAATIRRGMASADREARSLALEGMEGLAPKRLRQALGAFFEEHDPGLLAERARASFGLAPRPVPAVLVDMVTDGDRVLKAVAVHAVGRHGNEAFAPLLERVLEGRDALLCGLAVGALIRIRTGRSIMKEQLSLIEKLMFLERAPIFASLAVRELTAVARIAVETEAAAGEPVFREGDFGGGMYLLVEGRVGIWKEQSGARVRLAELAAGAAFGEMALFEKKPRSAAAIAATDARLLEVGAFEFEEIMKEHPEIAINICRVFSERLRETNEILLLGGK